MFSACSTLKTHQICAASRNKTTYFTAHFASSQPETRPVKPNFVTGSPISLNSLAKYFAAICM